MPIDYGLDKLSTDELLGVAKTPAAPSAPPQPSSAPATDYGLDKLPANELLGTAPDPAAESAKTAALFEASFGNPTEEVKKRNLSAAIQRMSGEFAPPAILDPADAQRQVDRLSADHATRASPRTSEFLSVPENAAVAMQDAKTMAQIEKIVGGDPLRSLEITAKRLAMSPANLGAWGFDIAAVVPDILGETAGAVGLAPQYNIFRDMAAGSRRNAIAARNAIDYLTPEARGMVERAAASAGTSAGTSLQLAPLAMMGTGAGAGMAAAFGIGTFGESYTKAREEGKNPIQALQFAIPQGAFEGLFEMMPAAFLADALKKAPPMKEFFLGLAAREVPTELMTTLAQNLNEWVTFNPGKSAADFIAEQPEALAETAIATIMGAGLQAGIIHGVQRTTGQFQQKAEERRTQQLQQTLIDLMDQSKQIKADPVTFQNFMAGVTDNASVFINADALQETLAQNKMDASVLPSLAEQLAQPSVTGDVEVPIGELMTAFAGTPAQEQIVQHARVRQDDLSAAEQAKFGDMGAFFKQQGEAVMEKQKANEAFVSEVKAIEDELTKELEALPPLREKPFKPHELRAQARVIASMYGALADMAGMSPAEARAMTRPNILGPDGAAPPRAATVTLGAPSTISWKSGKYTFTETRTYEHRADDGRVSRTTVDEDGNTKKEWLIVKKDGAEVWSEGGQQHKDDDYANVTPQRAQEIANEDLPAGATDTAPSADNLSQGFDHGEPMVNIGLDIGDVQNALSEQDAIAMLQSFGVTVTKSKVQNLTHDWGKENTLVAHLDRALTPDEMARLMAATQQEAIPQYEGGVGTLYHATPEAAEKWGPFNPEYFRDLEGVSLLDSQKELAQAQSTRRPTTKRAAEDHLGEVSLVVDYTKIEPEKTEQNMKLVSKYPGIRFKARKADGRAEEFIQHVTNNLLWLHDQIPAEIRQRSKLWYDGARAITDRWSAKYDKTDAQIAAILAVYSPQKDWFMNVSLAERTLDIVANQQDTAWSPEMTEVADKILADEKFSMLRGAIEGKKLSELKDRLEQAAWLRAFDEAHNNRGHRLVTPEGGFIEFATSVKGAEKKTGWPGFGTIIKALYVIDDGSPKMIDNALGGEHKVRSFYNNIFHPTSDQGFVTIDTHAVAAGLLRPLSGNSVEVTHNFGGAGTATSAATGMSGTYAYYQEAYRRAAEARGLLPREMQSITWEAVRELYTMGFKHDTAKMAVVDKLWSEYEKGKRDLDSVRAGILNLAGGVEQPSWVGRDSGISPEGWASTYTGELLGDSVPRRDTGVEPGAGERAAAGVSGSELAQLNRNVGAVAGPVVGIHYSKAPRTSLSSSAFGQGMPGAERERIAASNDPRIKQRVAFYVNTGNGIKPEDGVGGHAHSATLRNLYDADADALKIWKNAGDDTNAAESAVLDAGFDGYLTRNFGKQGAVVMLGKRSIDAASVKKEDVDTVAEQPPSPEIPKMKQAAMAIMQNRALPNGRQSVESWRRDLERSDPDTAALIAWAKIPAGDYYKDQIAGQLWQDAPALFAEAAGPRRGSFNPLTFDLRLLADANRSTFIHEASHFFMAAYIDMASQPDAPPALKQYVEDLLGYLFKKVEGPAGQTGTNLERWNAMTLDQQRPYWEFFAEGWEQYAMSGKAPTKALQSAFSAFAKWMKQIYTTLKNFVQMHGTKPLDAELTQYFDRMLATDEELEAARADRGFQTLFRNLAESGMSPSQFADYMALDSLQKTEAEELLRSRSIRDMKWLSGAKTKAIKEIQAEADELRNLVRAGVEEELANTPIRQAERWLRSGEMVQDGEQIKATAGHRLDIAVIKAMFPEGAIAGQIDMAKLGRGKNALASTSGPQHPDDVARIFGFRNGEQLVRELIDMPSFKDEVAHLTDLRMLEEHGDLATPQAIEKAADEAIHNDAHLRMVATEVWALTNRTGSVAALTKAAKAFAAHLVDNTVVKKLSPTQFANAATRAGKAAVRAMAKKETDEAASEKRTEMVNAAAAKAAYAAEAEVRAIMTRLRKISAYSDKHSSVTSREMGVVQAVRAILAEFGIGQHGEKATKYLKTLSEYDPTLGAVLDETIETLAPEAKPWDKLKVADLRELHAAVTGLWRVAKDVRSVELAGEKMSLDDARAQLIAKLEETGAKSRQSKAFSLTDAEIRNQDFMSYAAKAVRPENWMSMKDGLDSYGPWRRLIWNTIDRAQLGYNADKVEKLKQLKALLIPVMSDMTDIQIDAPELGGTFGAGSVIGYSELLHAILHTGNTSNKTKLLVGRGWGALREDGTLDSSKWDAFMKRLYAEGKITKAHMDFVQGVWDLLESMKEGAQKAHRAATGRYFEEIEPTEIVTPFGVYRGGYAPAIVDRRQVADMDVRKLQEAAEMDVVHSFEKPAGGFTKSRVTGYNQKLELNIAALGRHIDQVLLFSHMSVPVRNVQRVLKGKDLSSALAEQDRAAMAHVLAPWLHSAATQTVTEKGKLSYENMALFTKLRSRAGMALMFANVSNSIQQLTSLFPAMLDVGKKDLLFAAAKGWYKPREMAASIAEMSPYMKQRIDNEVHAMAEEIDQILLNPTKFEKMQDWAVAHSYFLQTAVDTVISPIIWQAKFNEATARGAEKQEAIDLADSSVRKSQGSNRAIDIAAMEKGSPFYRMFMQFAGFFNSQINLIGEKLAREKLLPKSPTKYGRIGMILAMGWLAPAIASQIIAVAMRGGPDDMDGDGLWDDWLAELLLAPIKYATAAIPVFGQAINATVNAFNDKPYDDRMSISPAVGMLDASIRGAQAAVKSFEDPTKAGRAVRDLGSFLSLFGVPVTPVSKAVGYATDVATGKVSPTSEADYARGIITGVASPESKQ